MAGSIYFWRATGGAGALAETWAPGINVQIHEIRIHLSTASATAEDLTATLDHNKGAAYDCTIFTQDLNTLADYSEQFTMPRVVLGGSGDELDFAWGNTDNRNWGLEVVFSPV